MAESDVSRFAEPISGVREVERPAADAPAFPVYYAFPDGSGGWDGLLRFDGATFFRATGGGWVEDNDLARYLVDPGADGPEVVTAEVAAAQAEKLGVPL